MGAPMPQLQRYEFSAAAMRDRVREAEKAALETYQEHVKRMAEADGSITTTYRAIAPKDTP